MFTDNGKRLIARKIGGMTDSGIDFLSIGIGANAIQPTISGVSDVSHQSGPMLQMGHEVARIPVVSTLPSRDGVIKCLAELPSNINCEMTEVGLWTHDINSGSTRPRTQVVSAFDSSESWLQNGTTSLNVITSQSGDTDYTRHNAEVSAGRYSMYSPYNDIMWSMKPDRRVRKEGFRFSQQGILMRGDSSNLGSWPYSLPASNYVSRMINGLPFDAAGPDDELRLSYFVSPTNHTTSPDSVKMAVVFRTSDGKAAVWRILHNPSTTINIGYTSGSSQVSLTKSLVLRDGDTLWNATALGYPVTFNYNDPSVPNGSATTGTISMKAAIATGTYTSAINQVAMSHLTNKSMNNVYFTQRTRLFDDTVDNRTSITYDQGFMWANVVEMRVFTTVNSSPASNVYIGFDALSYINTDVVNPGYGMVAYDVARNYETRGVVSRLGSPTSVLFEVKLV